MKDKQKKTKMKNSKGGNLSTVMIICLLVVGVLVMSYPTISNFYNELTGSYVIQEFNENMSTQNEVDLAEQRMMAEVYNAALQTNMDKIDCPYDYNDIMDFGNGMMGYIEIPIIDVYLPVYHTVDERVLTKGVGHIPKTAFPIGGEGNHSVLTGHTGLPSAELFTDLEKVQMGDRFFIHIAGDVVAYEVDQILVVLPEEVDDIMPVAGKDYCTLVTCTPYGINSHRLLVRGYQIDVEEVTEVVDEVNATTDFNWMVMILGVVGAITITMVIVTYRIAKKRKK